MASCCCPSDLDDWAWLQRDPTEEIAPVAAAIAAPSATPVAVGDEPEDHNFPQQPVETFGLMELIPMNAAHNVLLGVQL